MHVTLEQELQRDRNSALTSRRSRSIDVTFGNLKRSLAMTEDSKLSEREQAFESAIGRARLALTEALLAMAPLQGTIYGAGEDEEFYYRIAADGSGSIEEPWSEGAVKIHVHDIPLAHLGGLVDNERARRQLIRQLERQAPLSVLVLFATTQIHFSLRADGTALRQPEDDEAKVLRIEDLRQDELRRIQQEWQVQQNYRVTRPI